MSITLLHPYPLSFPSPSLRFLCHSWWTCWSTPKHTWRIRSDSLLATGCPISVVPPSIRHGLGLQILPEPGWQGSAPTWYGIACAVGRARIWLPDEETPGLSRDFLLLVLLPKRDLPDAPP